MILADTIRELTRDHLEKGGLLYGQCLKAVGWVGGTVPDCKNLIELPTSDVSNGGVVVGAGLAGRRPIYVIRYQGFLWLNAASLVNYAAKSKAMWGISCPVFIRALGMENGMGPVASHMHHSMVLRMPGMVVAAPYTPKEWKEVWQYFLEHDDPVFCSEHRASFTKDLEMKDIIKDGEVTLFAISQARVNALKALESLPASLSHIVWLKPLRFQKEGVASLRRSKFGVVIDCDYPCGTAEPIAYQLMHLTGKPVYALGLKDRTAGFSRDNITPTAEEIVQFSQNILKSL